jgi:hypothetical protein
MSFKDLKVQVKGAVDDLATLEVASFTGSQIDLSIDLSNVTGNEVFKTIKEKLTTSTLVAYSRFEIDGDAMNYINSDLGADKKYLIDGHNSMVEGAQKSRKDFIDFVLKVLRVKDDLD